MKVVMHKINPSTFTAGTDRNNFQGFFASDKEPSLIGSVKGTSA